eukprot:scaffold80956_cov17-Tisochrysis_lutea.AAC.1
MGSHKKQRALISSFLLMDTHKGRRGLIKPHHINGVEHEKRRAHVASSLTYGHTQGWAKPSGKTFHQTS